MLDETKRFEANVDGLQSLIKIGLTNLMEIKDSKRRSPRIIIRRLKQFKSKYLCKESRASFRHFVAKLLLQQVTCQVQRHLSLSVQFDQRRRNSWLHGHVSLITQSLMHRLSQANLCGHCIRPSHKNGSMYKKNSGKHFNSTNNAMNGAVCRESAHVQTAHGMLSKSRAQHFPNPDVPSRGTVTWHLTDPPFCRRWSLFKIWVQITRQGNFLQ